MSQEESKIILVVDDDDIKRYTITRFLKQAGYQTLEANAGLQAVEMTNLQPDLIVLDVKLPDITGHEVCRRLRMNPLTAAIPIMQVSAVYVESQDRVQGLENGADAYLTSFNEPSEWIATIRALLRSRELEKKHRVLMDLLQKTFNSVLDGVCILNNSYEVMHCNQSLMELIGKPYGAIVEQSFPSLFPPDSRSEILAMIDALETTRRRQQIDVQLDGHEVHLMMDPVYDRLEIRDGAICLFFDATADKIGSRKVEPGKTLEQKVEEQNRSITKYQNLSRNLVTDLALAEQREKKRLAGELHDYLAQLLTCCRMKLDLMGRNNPHIQNDENLLDIYDIIDRSVRYTRNLIAELNPRILYSAGLVPALYWLSEQMMNHNLRVDIREEIKKPSISEEVSVLLFQIVRELLFNIVKHAQTNQATMSLVQDQQNLIITVEDHGVGFSATNSTRQYATDGHYGLFSVQERIESIGGVFDLQSAPQLGTRITLMVPLA